MNTNFSQNPKFDNENFIDSVVNIELHAHPNFEKYSAMDVANVMEENELDIVAFSGPMNSSIYSEVVKRTMMFYPETVKDNKGIRFDGNKLFLNAGEYSTQEGFHILTIGYSKNASKNSKVEDLIKEGIDNDALVIIAHPFVDNEKSMTAGHISSEKEAQLKQLCSDYAGKIAVEWNGYCHPALRWGLKQGFGLWNALKGSKNTIEYHDVNEKVVDLARESKWTIPLISATDLHALNSSYLKSLGKSAFAVSVQGKTPAQIFSSMKGEVLSDRVYVSDKYASAPHVVGAFCIPVVKELVYGRKE